MVLMVVDSSVANWGEGAKASGPSPFPPTLKKLKDHLASLYLFNIDGYRQAYTNIYFRYTWRQVLLSCLPRSRCQRSQLCLRGLGLSLSLSLSLWSLQPPVQFGLRQKLCVAIWEGWRSTWHCSPGWAFTSQSVTRYHCRIHQILPGSKVDLLLKRVQQETYNWMGLGEK